MVSTPAVCSREALTHCFIDFITSQGAESEALQTHSRPGGGFAHKAGSTLTSCLLCPWGQELSASRASPLCPPAACPRPKQAVSLGKGASRGYSQELGDGAVTANFLPPDSAVSLPRLPWGLGWVLRAMSRKGILGQRGVRRSGRAVGLLPRGLHQGAELWRPARTCTHPHTQAHTSARSRTCVHTLARGHTHLHTPTHTCTCNLPQQHPSSPHPPSARPALPLPGWGHPAVMEPGAGPHSGGLCRQAPHSSLPEKGLGGTLPLSGPTCPCC